MRGLDGYASVLRLMELAFEWEIMSYTYYPFYWGDRNRWSELYNAESDDQLFRSFLQSGMARVIATVRPGFERAVLYYMATGKVWESAEPPVFSDQVIISVLAQVESTDEKELAKWETRVPTTLTVIQDSTVGLDASGLPCACGENGGEAEPDFEGKNRQLSRLLGAEAGGGEPM